MQAQESYTIADVVQLSRQSESTIRRLIGRKLWIVPRSRPRRLAADSVHAYLQGLLDEGPQLPDGVGEGVDRRSDWRSPVSDEAGQAAERTLRERIDELEQTIGDLQKTVRKLRRRNERFRNTIQALRQSGTILLDDLGAYTSPRIPNN
ncbi:MAG TPA: hypothetical protein VH496_07770 [Mycobacterium sp.]|jgi:hypothetical protein